MQKSVLLELCWLHLAKKIWTSWSKKFGTNCKGTTVSLMGLIINQRGNHVFVNHVLMVCRVIAISQDRRERSDELLGIFRSDVCGNIETKSLSGAEYFKTFINDKSRFVWVYTLKHKSEVFEKLTKWWKNPAL